MTPDVEAIQDWEFRNQPPTTEQVIDLLGKMPDVYGLRYVDYADWVQALPQTKKIVRKVPTSNGGVRKEDEYVDTWTLYMSVAGRVKMVNDAAVRHGWRVDFEPEPRTATGIPGMVQMDENRIVYREYCVIDGDPYDEATGDVREPVVRGRSVRGRKPGMAWVPTTGGKQAAGSNPYEKVETSARGRAIAAWGIGILPGSGIASLEEMLGARQNERALSAAAAAAGGDGGYTGRKSREEIMEEALTAAEQVRQMRRLSETEMRERIGVFLSNLGITSPYNAEADEVDWARVKDGQLSLLLNSFRDTLRDLRAQEAPL